jgi:hypothetical protein
MSMSTHVVGFREPDAKWEQMKRVYDACKAAKLKVPKEVEEFFNGEPPDPKGVAVDLTSVTRAWDDGQSSQGFEIKVSDIPKNVTYIRFYNNW